MNYQISRTGKRWRVWSFKLGYALGFFDTKPEAEAYVKSINTD